MGRAPSEEAGIEVARHVFGMEEVFADRQGMHDEGIESLRPQESLGRGIMVEPEVVARVARTAEVVESPQLVPMSDRAVRARHGLGRVADQAHALRAQRADDGRLRREEPGLEHDAGPRAGRLDESRQAVEAALLRGAHGVFEAPSGSDRIGVRGAEVVPLPDEDDRLADSWSALDGGCWSRNRPRSRVEERGRERPTNEGAARAAEAARPRVARRRDRRPTPTRARAGEPAEQVADRRQFACVLSDAARSRRRRLAGRRRSRAARAPSDREPPRSRGPRRPAANADRRRA